MGNSINHRFVFYFRLSKYTDGPSPDLQYRIVLSRSTSSCSGWCATISVNHCKSTSSSHPFISPSLALQSICDSSCWTKPTHRGPLCKKYIPPSVHNCFLENRTDREPNLNPLPEITFTPPNLKWWFVPIFTVLLKENWSQVQGKSIHLVMTEDGRKEGSKFPFHSTNR